MLFYLWFLLMVRQPYESAFASSKLVYGKGFGGRTPIKVLYKYSLALLARTHTAERPECGRALRPCRAEGLKIKFFLSPLARGTSQVRVSWQCLVSSKEPLKNVRTSTVIQRHFKTKEIYNEQHKKTGVV